MRGAIEYEVGEGIGGPIVVVFYCGGGMFGVHCGRRRSGGNGAVGLILCVAVLAHVVDGFEQLDEVHPLY